MNDSQGFSTELLQRVRRAIRIDGYYFLGEADREICARLEKLLKAEGYNVLWEGVGVGNSDAVIYDHTRRDRAELHKIAQGGKC